jgi:hypothetical protein
MFPAQRCKYRVTSVALIASAFGTVAHAADTPSAGTVVQVPVVTVPVAAVAPAITADPNRALPPMRWFGTVAGEELYKLVKADPRFAQINSELIGSPVLLRVSHSFEATSGGKAAGFTSAILAGSTLGLLPVVTNSDLVITYELVVNGTTLSTYSYRKNFTRSFNIYAKDDTYGLGKEGLVWAKSTVAEFLTAARSDAKLAALVAEYEFYFPTAAG